MAVVLFVFAVVCTSVQKSIHKLGRTRLKQLNIIWLFKIESKCIQLDGWYAQHGSAHTLCNRERTQCRNQSNGNIAQFSVGQPQEYQLLPLLGPRNHSFVNYQVLGKGHSLRTSVITAEKAASESLSSMSLCQQIKVVYGQKCLYPTRKRNQRNRCLSGFILVKMSNKGTSQIMRKVTRICVI